MAQGNNNEQNNENVKKPQAAQDLDNAKDGVDLFITEADRQWILNTGDELLKNQLKEYFLYYSIDYKKTKTHRLYAQAKKKHYLPEVKVNARIDVETNPPEYMAPGGLIRQGLGKITAHIYLHHLEELGLELRMGDFVYHKGNYYEVVDDGKSNISNEYALGGDKFFYLTLIGAEVNSDVFKGR